jgi:hypothetical protein
VGITKVRRWADASLSCFRSLHWGGCITARIELDRKAGWGNGPRPLALTAWTVVYRLRGFRFRQVSRLSFATPGFCCV